jgi:hypothetical protein
MLKVRFEAITLRVPVIDNSGEHDAKMDEDDFELVEAALGLLDRLSGVAPRPSGHTALEAGTQRAMEQDQLRMARSYSESAHLQREALSGITHALIGSAPPPVSQADPVIDTTVRDSEMRSSEPEMTLEELRERPEKTRSPPRPRANSWRHGNG